MTRPTSSPRMPLRLVLSGAGAALLLAATVVAGAYLGTRTQQRFDDIDASWRIYTGEAESRGELLSRIRAHLGYGGIIHNFKNYVLRQDPVYLAELRRQLDDFTATVVEYRIKAATSHELGFLDTIERTIGAYRDKIPIAEQAARENWPPARTDTLVKVDDTEALAALAELDRFWQDKQRQAGDTIAAAVQEGNQLVATGFRFLAGLFVVAVVVYALFFVLQRELRRTIALLSRELIERRAAEHDAKKFKRAVEQSPATIIITDTHGRIEYVNEKFTELTGYEPGEVIGHTPRLLQSGDEPRQTYTSLRQQLARGEEWHGTFRNRKKNGELYWAKTAILPLRDGEGRVTNLIGLGEDITERNHAREQIHRAQKMEAVGLLASGVAHDFNNVLTTILGNVHLARLDAPGDGEFAEELEQIEVAAKRARNLVGQVLAFARRQPGEPVTLRAGDIVAEVARLMRASIQPNIHIVSEIEADDISVLADPTRLHQVIMNLCSNAAEAIGPNGGTITLKVARDTPANGGASEVMVSVRDDGPGIAPQVADKIFDPFFTTKPVGKATGLGLSVVANLVADMGGQVAVESRPGKGSLFQVRLPEIEPATVRAEHPQTLAQGSGTLLLIDDEQDVLETCAKILRRLNYRVEGFTDPRRGVAAFAANPDRFALVMTDFMMPEMNGREVCEAVRALRPQCPIIVASAYRTAGLDAENLAPLRLLDKPIDPPQLSRTVHNLLTASAAG